MWMMDKFPWYERLILSLTKKMRGFSSTLFLLFQMHRCYYAIEEMGKITIAAINGSCSGGGTEMGTCFDFRFMIDDQGFSISQPEALVGIVPGGGGNTRLPRLIGKAKALEFMLTAEESKRNNLITDHFPKKDFHAKVQEFADRMSRRIPVAVREIKNTVHKGLDASLMHCLSIEMGGTVRCFADKYTQNALKEYVKVIKERIEEPKGKRGTIAENLILMQSDEIINRIFKE
jgi:enoyl-CoA hydratase/carnithine racemase